jgi:hypothetical protein
VGAAGCGLQAAAAARAAATAACPVARLPGPRWLHAMACRRAICIAPEIFCWCHCFPSLCHRRSPALCPLYPVDSACTAGAQKQPRPFALLGPLGRELNRGVCRWPGADVMTGQQGATREVRGMYVLLRCSSCSCSCSWLLLSAVASLCLSYDVAPAPPVYLPWAPLACASLFVVRRRHRSAQWLFSSSLPTSN